MHSCPERVSFLLESVSGVQKATADFASQSAIIRANGVLCSDQQTLLQSLEQGAYKGRVVAVR